MAPTVSTEVMDLQDIVYIFLQERYGNVKRNDWISPSTMIRSSDFSVMILNEYWYIGNIEESTWRKGFTGKFINAADPKFFETIEADCNDMINNIAAGRKPTMQYGAVRYTGQ